MSSVLLKINAKTFIFVNTFLGMFTICMCYFISQLLHHVHVFIPMISDCFVHSPESYISRFGVISFICCGNLISNLAISQFISSSQFIKKLLFIISFINSISFGIVGAVSEEDNLIIHNASALTGYISYGLYLIISHLTSEESKRNNTVFPYITALLLKVTTLKPIIDWCLTIFYSISILTFGNNMEDQYISITI